LEVVEVVVLEETQLQEMAFLDLQIQVVEVVHKSVAEFLVLAALAS
jgi:hypothetical protein